MRFKRTINGVTELTASTKIQKEAKLRLLCYDKMEITNNELSFDYKIVSLIKSLPLSALSSETFYGNRTAKFHYTEVKQRSVASQSERGGGNPAMSHEGKVFR